MSLYETRKEAMDACKYEANTAKRYSENAIRLAANGECSKAWDMADISRMAAKCAMQAHEELWALTEGKLTDDEFEEFEMAEIAQSDASRAEKAAAAAVEKQNKKSADGNRLWHEGALKVYGDSFIVCCLLIFFCSLNHRKSERLVKEILEILRSAVFSDLYISGNEEYLFSELCQPV